MRYTRKQLIVDLEVLNTKLPKNLSLQAQGRNGYTGLDVFEGTLCLNTVTCGTPRECYTSALEYVLEVVTNIHKI